MGKRVITKEAVRQVLKDYWLQYKAHRWQAIVAFVLPALGTIFVFFVPPLVIAMLVDAFVAQGEISLEAAMWYIAAFGGFWLLGEALWRTGAHMLIKLETSGIGSLSNTAFNRLTERDYDFYTNNFVGSLTKRATAFARGFEVFTDTLSFSIINNIFPLIFAVVVLWQYSPFIPILLLACVGIAVSVGIPIVRRRSKLVALRHEASSKVAGRISDSMTNIMTIKSFAKEGWEQEAFSEYVDDYALKFKKAANYQNLRFDMFMSPPLCADERHRAYCRPRSRQELRTYRRCNRDSFFLLLAYHQSLLGYKQNVQKY